VSRDMTVEISVVVPVCNEAENVEPLAREIDAALAGRPYEMIFIDDESKPAIVGTGSEDYFLGSWDFGGQFGAQPFAHAMYGAHLITAAERTGGRYCCYRWHGDNPVTFERYLKHTMEHGHANDRVYNFYSCAYCYQTTPYTDLPALRPVADRIVK